MRFRLLGGLAAEDDDGAPIDLGGPKQRAVLASLLIEPGRPVNVDRLQDLVWGDDPPANPETSLQAYVSNLRRALEPDRRPRQPPRLLVTRPTGYAVLADRDHVDVTRFEDAATRGQALLADGDPAGAAAALDTALAEWTGPLLPELAGQPWVDEPAAWLDGLRTQAELARFDAGLALGDHAALLPRIERAVAEHPFEEHLHAQHALALYRSGRQRDALGALSSAAATLRGEAGVEPGPELRELERRILDQDPSLSAPTAARAPDHDRRAGGRGDPSPPVWSGPERRRPTTSDDRHEPQPRAGAFVGRSAELSLLCDAAAAAATAGGRPVVISGEPGIGKTRLVEELVADLPASTVVAWGRCPESAASAAYWPCIQLGRQLEGAGALPADLIGSLLPDDDVLAAPADDAAAERLGLHASVADLLAAASEPLVLVIDDIHWADSTSLRLMEFVAGELRRTNVLLIATTRPVTPDSPPALVDCLGELARQPGAVRVDLGGLSTAAVGEWLADRADAPATGADAATTELAAAIHDRTGGNPFFVGELVALLGAEAAGAPSLDVATVRSGRGVPAAVQDVVRRRVGRLPADTQQLLSAASVIGRTFELDVLATVAGEPLVAVLDGIEPAQLAGLVTDTDVPGRFAFSHALVAETLAAELSTTRRARLHAATARALAHLRSTDLDGHLADLAHHAVEGAIAGTAQEAYDWSVRAARHASARLAHEDAAAHWARAGQAIALADPGNVEARYEVLFEEGQAWLRVDAVAPGYEALVRALDLAIAGGDDQVIARTAAAFNVDGVWSTSEVATTSVDAATALERALDVLPDQPSPERVVITGALAEAVYWVRSPRQLDELTARAVADARALGDPAILGRALHKRNLSLWRAASYDERAVAAGELFDLAEQGVLPPDLETLARFGIAGIRWEAADVAGAAAEVAAAQRLAHELGSPALMTQIDWFASTIELFRGNLDDALRLNDRAYDLYRRTRRWSAEALGTGLRLGILAELDRVDDVRRARAALVDSPYGPWFQEGYAWYCVQVGDLDEADDVLRDVPMPPLYDSWLFVGFVATAVHNRVALGRTAAIAPLLAELAPYQGRLATVGTGTAFGDVHMALAAGHHLLGDADEARRHADASVRVLTAAGPGPDLVRSLMLRADIRPDTAPADLAEAAAIAESRGLPLLRRRLAERA